MTNNLLTNPVVEPDEPRNSNIYTQTALSALLKCPKSYRLRYIEGYRPKEENDNLVMGSLWHELREGKNISPVMFSNEYLYTKLTAMNAAYLDIMGEISGIASEVSFSQPLTNPDTGRISPIAIVAGKIDKLHVDENGAKWIVEYKTSSDIDPAYFRTIELNLQVHVYKRMYEKQTGEKIEGILYDIIKKPSIKQLKPSKKNPDGESLADYGPRLEAWYHENKESAFHREKFRINNSDVERELWRYHQEILWRTRENHWPRNPGSCSNYYGICGFYGYCSTGDSEVILETEFKRQNPHEELPENISKLWRQNNGDNAAD